MRRKKQTFLDRLFFGTPNENKRVAIINYLFGFLFLVMPVLAFFKALAAPTPAIMIISLAVTFLAFFAGVLYIIAANTQEILWRLRTGEGIAK